MIIAVTVIAIIFLIFLSGFLSGSETSLTAVSRAKMHQLEKEGDGKEKLKAKKVNLLVNDMENVIGAILLGNNLVNILASALATSLFIQLLGQGGVAVATLVMTAFILIFAEVLPKTYAITRADAVAMRVAKPISWLKRTTRWLVLGIRGIARFTLKIVGVKKPVKDDGSAEAEIRGVIELHHSEASIEDTERNILFGAMDLEKMNVYDVMVHRTNMSMINAEDPTEEIVKIALDTPYSRLPVYLKDEQQVVGILYTKDLMRELIRVDGDTSKINILEISRSRQPWIITENVNLKEQLDEFLKKKQHVALVVDEYGVIQGMLTLEDILEEIVGDIEDEYDQQAAGVIKPIGTNSYEIEGTYTVRDFNRSMGTSIPSDQAVTLAGLYLAKAKRIPETGDELLIEGHKFEVMRRTHNQIELLKITPLPQISYKP